MGLILAASISRFAPEAVNDAYLHDNAAGLCK